MILKDIKKYLPNVINMLCVTIILIIASSCQKEILKTIQFKDGLNSIVRLKGIDTTYFDAKHEYFTTTNNGEKVDRLIIGTNPSWSMGEVVYSLFIPELKAGDIVVAKGEVQGTISVNYNVAFGGYLILTDSPHKKGEDSPKIELSEDNGFNIEPGMRSGVLIKVGTYTSQQVFTKIYINFCCKAFSSAARPPNDILIIEKDYGRLAVTIFRK